MAYFWWANRYLFAPGVASWQTNPTELVLNLLYDAAAVGIFLWAGLRGRWRIFWLGLAGVVLASFAELLFLYRDAQLQGGQAVNLEGGIVIWHLIILGFGLTGLILDWRYAKRT